MEENKKVFQHLNKSRSLASEVDIEAVAVELRSEVVTSRT